MPGGNITTTAKAQHQYIRQYYKFHARLYDLTRWAFLFGRTQLLQMLPFDSNKAIDILEVGCGTGFNLKRLSGLFPNATLTGVDLSPDMIERTTVKLSGISNKTMLLEQPYGKEKPLNRKFDVILFSYSLSMINPQWAEVLEQAAADLKPEGVVAVVDFHQSRFPLFWRWMQAHNVMIGGHLYHELNKRFEPQVNQVLRAYSGLWEYFIFIGKNKSLSS